MGPITASLAMLREAVATELGLQVEAQRFFHGLVELCSDAGLRGVLQQDAPVDLLLIRERAHMTRPCSGNGKSSICNLFFGRDPTVAVPEASRGQCVTQHMV